MPFFSISFSVSYQMLAILAFHESLKGLRTTWAMMLIFSNNYTLAIFTAQSLLTVKQCLTMHLKALGCSFRFTYSIFRIGHCFIRIILHPDNTLIDLCRYMGLF